jgi:hypothetical protein
MKFTTSIPGFTLLPAMGGQPDWARDMNPDLMHRIVERVDACGIDMLILPWHMAIQAGQQTQTMGPRWPDPLSAAGFVLGATRRVTVAPLVVAPCHQPIPLAKSLSTLDWISGGRCLPILLSGYVRWEFDLLGANYAERDAVTDEYVEAMLELWRADQASFHGRFVSFDDVTFEPKPLRQPLPLWFGGKATASLRRVARRGAGWMSYATPHKDIPRDIEYIRSQPDFVDRPLDIFAYFLESTHDPITHEEDAPPAVPVGDAAVLEQLEWLASLGVNATGAPLSSFAENGRLVQSDSVESYLDRLDWLGDVIIPAVRKKEMQSA